MRQMLQLLLPRQTWLQNIIMRWQVVPDAFFPRSAAQESHVAKGDNKAQRVGQACQNPVYISHGGFGRIQPPVFILQGV